MAAGSIKLVKAGVERRGRPLRGFAIPATTMVGILRRGRLAFGRDFGLFWFLLLPATLFIAARTFFIRFIFLFLFLLLLHLSFWGIAI